MNIGLIAAVVENMLCAKIHESKLQRKFSVFLVMLTSQIATNIDIDIFNFKKILRFIKSCKTI